MKTEKKPWRPSPAIIALMTAFIMIAGTMLIGWLNARRYRVNARVEIAEPINAAESLLPPASATATTLPDGEVARMAERIRESAALLMGLSILTVTEQMNHRVPTNADSLLKLMVERNLLPPNVRQTSAKDILLSIRATIYLRYRLDPLGIEIISIGRESIDGPPTIARLDARGGDNSGAILLISKKTESSLLPKAFAPLTEINTADWSIEPLRERSFNPGEIDQLNQWVRQYAERGK